MANSLGQLYSHACRLFGQVHFNPFVNRNSPVIGAQEYANLPSFLDQVGETVFIDVAIGREHTACLSVYDFDRPTFGYPFFAGIDVKKLLVFRS